MPKFTSLAASWCNSKDDVDIRTLIEPPPSMHFLSFLSISGHSFDEIVVRSSSLFERHSIFKEFIMDEEIKVKSQQHQDFHVRRSFTKTMHSDHFKFIFLFRLTMRTTKSLTSVVMSYFNSSYAARDVWKLQFAEIASSVHPSVGIEELRQLIQTLY